MIRLAGPTEAHAGELDYDMEEISVAIDHAGTGTHIVWDQDSECVRFGGEDYVTKVPRRIRIDPEILPEDGKELAPGGLEWMQFDLEVSKGPLGSLAKRVAAFESRIDHFEEAILRKQLEFREERRDLSPQARGALRGHEEMVTYLRDEFRKAFPATAVAGAVLGREQGGPDSLVWMCTAVHPYHQHTPWVLPIRGRWKSDKKLEVRLQQGLSAARTPLEMVLFYSGLVDVPVGDRVIRALPQEHREWRNEIRKAGLPGLLWPFSFPAEGQRERAKRHLEHGSVLCAGLISKSVLSAARKHLEGKGEPVSQRESNDLLWRAPLALSPLVDSVAQSKPVKRLLGEVRQGNRIPYQKETRRRAAAKARHDGQARSLEILEAASGEVAWAPSVLQNAEKYAREAALRALAGPRELFGYPKVDGTYTGKSWVGKEVGELAAMLLIDLLNAADQRAPRRETEPGEGDPIVLEPEEITIGLSPELAAVELVDHLEGVLVGSQGLEAEENAVDLVMRALLGGFRRGDLALLLAIQGALEGRPSLESSVAGVERAFASEAGCTLPEAIFRLGPEHPENR